MDLIKVKNASYDRYEELLLKRDQLLRECGGILTSYTKEFGELSALLFEQKVECIKQKKAIAYCQALINRGDSIDPSEMQNYLDQNMAMYYDELKRMLRENEQARESKVASLADERRAKKLYRRLAKTLHPDINPMTLENPVLEDLWNRIVVAYHGINPIELANLEILVNKAVSEMGMDSMEIDIPDIEERIQALEDEINEIITSEPYVWQDLLEDQEQVKAKKEALQKELDEYTKYHAELDSMLEQLIIQGGVTIQWRMN